MEKDLVSDDWKTKEYEKFILSKKYHNATDFLGQGIRDPNIENIKLCYAAIYDYVCSIPLLKDKQKETREIYLKKLDEIGKIIHGDLSNPEIQTLIKKYKLDIITERKQSRLYSRLNNLNFLLIELRKVLTDAGDFAVGCGLRISLYTKKKKGMEKMNEEEGIGTFTDDEEEG